MIVEGVDDLEVVNRRQRCRLSKTKFIIKSFCFKRQCRRQRCRLSKTKFIIGVNVVG